jgi:hypothetical protein
MPPFKVHSTVQQVEGGITISWNTNFERLEKIAGPRVTFRPDFPIRGNLIASRLIASAASENCDLYVGDPQGALVGNKLFQCGIAAGKPRDIVEGLKTRVSFPNVQKLINLDRIGFETGLEIRRKAGWFRSWLQDEKHCDMDAITAYHYEVAKETNLLKGSRSTFRLISTIGGAALGASPVVATAFGGPVAGAVMGAAAGWLLDMGSRIGAEWKPVVFGNWIKDRIERELSGRP